jgi:hypothetical protein
MSLRDLVRFAQNEISQFHEYVESPSLLDTEEADVYDAIDVPPLPSFPGREEPVILPSPEDSDSIAERPSMPDWIRNPQNQIIRIGGATVAVFTEADFDEPVPLPSGPVPEQGADTLAYYLPYHFYADGIWGVYLRAKGVLGLAAELKSSPITHGGDTAIRAAQISLFEHEVFHCLTEAAATRAEVVVRSAVYHPYFWDRYAAFHEEAVANAYAHGKIKKEYPAFVTRLESWMRSQGQGYRDFHRYAGRSLRKGRLKCTHDIIRFAPPIGPLPRRLPADFLFRKAVKIPTYVVLDAEIASSVLRPFPKHNGVVVKVHSREHPPPHIHVEMPLGKEVTRCEWPSLEPLEGGPQLSQKQRSRLREYLQRFGEEVCERLRSVYHNPQLQMPAI